jgi:hypothetical protein
MTKVILNLLGLGEDVYDISLAHCNTQIFFTPHSDVVTSIFTFAFQNGYEIQLKMGYKVG